MASADYLLKAVFMVLSLMPLKVLLLHAAKVSIQLTRASTSGAKLNLSLPIDTMVKLRA